MLQSISVSWIQFLGLALYLSKLDHVCGVSLPTARLPELPQEISVEELEEASLQALGGFMQQMFVSDDHTKTRALQSETYYPCNTVIDTLTVEDIRATGRNLIEEQQFVQEFAFPWAILLVLDMLLFSNLKYDLQVWKVCGRCSDFDPAIGVACEEHEYGYNATQSGLLIAPYNVAEDHLLESTLPVNILSAAGTGVVPSKLWAQPLRHPLPILGAFVSSGSKTYSLIPDNIGTGESEDYHKAFLIRQSLVTAMAPLLWQSESIVSQESNCASAMGDAFVISGYSEGGYGAVAVADALVKMNKTIIACHAGGGAYRLSSATVPAALQSVRGGNKHMTFYMALLGAALSSTTTDVANYGQGQDFFDDEWRDLLVEASDLRQNPLKMLIPDDDPMSVFNQDLVAVYETGMANGEAEPCLTSVTNDTDKLCQAIRDQDLVEILESATYPVYLCHSKDDEIIPYNNLPNMNANPYYLHLKTVTGRHEPAGAPCIVSTLLHMAGDKNLHDFELEDKTCDGGCGCQSTVQAPESLSPTGRCRNFLLSFFGFSCHVGETYEGVGFLGTDSNSSD